MADLGLKKGVDYKILCEGFMDAQHNFYTREDAFNFTLANGQLSASTRQLKRERNEKGQDYLGWTIEVVLGWTKLRRPRAGQRP